MLLVLLNFPIKTGKNFSTASLPQTKWTFLKHLSVEKPVMAAIYQDVHLDYYREALLINQRKKKNRTKQRMASEAYVCQAQG